MKKTLTNIIDYTDDGYKLIRQHGLVKQDNHEEIYNNLFNNITNKKLTIKNNWISINETKEIIIEACEIIKNIKLKQIEFEYYKKYKK
ncbi:MAG: hypothetical protein U5L02_01785 [Rheinheimera sp.]|nr:hypothetical protein [Rheinheimera sp.]